MEFTLDHVVLVVPDLEAAAAALEQRLGLRASPGGRHPALGTENALVPVGGAYLELVAVADEKAAEGTSFGRAALSAREHGARFAGWVARVDDLDAGARVMGEEVDRHVAADAERRARHLADGRGPQAGRLGAVPPSSAGTTRRPPRPSPPPSTPPAP